MKAGFPDGEALWAALPMPVVLIAGGDEILSLNGAAESFFLSSSRAMSGALLWQKVNCDSALKEAFERARVVQAPLFVRDIKLSLSSGQAHTCDLQIAPFGKDGGEMLLVINPHEINSHLPSTSSSVRSAIGMAEMLAHEIKNPLAGITGAAQLLGMGATPEDYDLSELIVGESRRIVKLLEQVEQFGNLSAPHCQPTNLHDVLDRARQSALVGFGSGLEIVQDYDPSLPPAFVDADQLLQVLLNLLKNATDAAGPNGHIRLRSFYEHGFRMRTEAGLGQPLPLQIEVIDNGCGIAPELMGDIFNPFVSGKENGTGLGLALSAKIIAAHAGWITCRSKPGETVFRLSLPRANDEKETD
ncbi:PAS domain-containing sensor histidine kinase [Lentibacter algarum]|uniref:two-component system sensor histidine kinase NtrB n=1 Tax=Lentibacter algarum TaxID=576131 RepID=UPI001C06EC7F|nr:ATP-binding protein [Lentibacter algarum]MBU2982301.1 PAS domain-containing sensor histidine kinase [Lentibacter algarum]